jgi:hypothetical protein
MHEVLNINKNNLAVDFYGYDKNNPFFCFFGKFEVRVRPLTLGRSIHTSKTT